MKSRMDLFSLLRTTATMHNGISENFLVLRITAYTVSVWDTNQMLSFESFCIHNFITRSRWDAANSDLVILIQVKGF